uniref:Transcription factor bHLH123 n=1 Tax=Anthurium amnicola TaxID=1678845 RepID=A0A1D1XEU8_9ARAE
MAEEFQTGVCSGSWWNATRSGFDGAEAAATATVSCSVAVTEAGGFGWTAEVMEGKARSCDDTVATASGGSSSVTFQDAPGVHVSDPMASSGFLMESTLPMADFTLSSPTVDWSQTLLRSSGRVEGGFHAMLHDDMSSRPYFRQETGIESNPAHAETDSMNLFRDMNHGFIPDQSHLNSSVGHSADCTVDSFPAVPVSLGCPPTLLQGLFEQDVKPHRSSYDDRSTDFMSPMSYHRSSSEDSSPAAWSRIPQFLKVSPPKQQQQQPTHQLQFSNNAPFWNASAGAVADMRSGFYSSSQAPFITQHKFEEQPNCSTITVKSGSEGARESSSGAKKSVNEPAFKKPRIETPSSLPTFKVRKEKLGDRITALQQLVSPFGKTDTASVLYEAIDYIKFLHDQVSFLSTPYLKNGPAMQHQQISEKLKDSDGPKQDLRSRGLCLVPISSTFAVANEPMSDFWSPTFGGTYR